jgi:hypothetical protein
MTKLVCFTAKAQGGKSSSANLLFGMELMALNHVEYFTMSPGGKLLVPLNTDDTGKIEDVEVDFSLSCPKTDNPNGLDFLVNNVWPYIKVYNFADVLKQTLMNVFDLTWEQCYGTDDDKNTPTKVLWANMPNRPKNMKRAMTARELMEYFGTDVCRAMYNNVWVEATMKRIKLEAPALAIIGDCRFPNEVEAIRQAGGKVIRLTKDGSNGNTHESNCALDADKYDWANFDAVVDNANMTIDEKNEQILGLMKEWKMFEYEVDIQEGNPNQEVTK